MTAKHISAVDPTIRKRVLFIVHDGWAVSMVTGYKFKYTIDQKGVKR